MYSSFEGIADDLILGPREVTPRVFFKTFEDTHEEWLNDQWFNDYFVHDLLALPELANCQEILTEHDFRWWYSDPPWTPADEPPQASSPNPTWARDSLSPHSSLPASIEEPSSRSPVIYSPALLQAIQRRARPRILYSSRLTQQIDRRANRSIPSPDTITTQLHFPNHVPKTNSSLHRSSEGQSIELPQTKEHRVPRARRRSHSDDRNSCERGRKRR